MHSLHLSKEKNIRRSRQSKMDNKTLNIYYEHNVKISRDDTKRTIKVVVPFVHNILEQVHKYDNRFKIQPLNAGSYYSNLKVAKPDEFDYSVILDTPPASFEQPNSLLIFLNKYIRFRAANLQNIKPGTYIQNRLLPVTTVYERVQNNHPHFKPSSSSTLQCPDGQQTSSPETTWQTSCDTVDALLANGNTLIPPVGQCFLLTDYANELLTSWSERGLDRGEACLTCGDVILPIKVKRRFRSLVTRAIDELNYQSFVHMVPMSESPATTLTLVNLPGINHGISIDLCPLVESKSPFPVKYNFPRQGARWPSQENAKRAMMGGVNIIAKHPIYWAISFAHCEKVLLEGIDKHGTCRKKSARILKRIREQFLCTGVTPVLTSYHLKNILLWECEEYPEESEWSQDSLSIRVTSMCKRLIHAIQEKSLPLYFFPKVNLFDLKEPIFLDQIGERIQMILRYPKQFFKV